MSHVAHARRSKPEEGGTTVGQKRYVRLVALFAVLSLVGASCSSGGSKKEGTGKTGGTYRIQTDAYQWNAAFDPTAEYLGFAFAWYSNLLVRTLLGYKHVAGGAGNELIPDLAAKEPEVSADGKTWTFTLRDGVKFSPPVNRAVTSKDVKYAFRRLANKSINAGGYAFYYDVIDGFVQGDTTPEDISGIQTPDDKTIVFHLKQATGDFGFRIAMPAAGPIPEEVGKCATTNGSYGRLLVSSGPYQIIGSAAQGNPATGCTALKPLTGFDPAEYLRLERNPNYDAGTDTTEARENKPDYFRLELNTNTDDIFNKIGAGEVDGESATPGPKVLQRYNSDSTLTPLLHKNSGDRTWYLFMNLTKPPFDDVHVRKAVNFVIDKPALIRPRGGVDAGIPAEHIIPPSVLGDNLKPGEFDPYATTNHTGDEAKAKEEMKLSKYDSNKDGICDAAVCNNVVHMTRNTPPYPDMAPVIEANFKKIGITLKTREVASFYSAVQVPKQTPALGSGAGWGKDYGDAFTFIQPLMDGRVIAKDATQNFALVGLTKEQASEIGIPYPAGGVPSIDADIDACAAKLDAERLTCWQDLDKKVMNEIVPWAPYLWANNIDVTSSAVTQYVFDQFSGEAALAHVAVDQTKQIGDKGPPPGANGAPVEAAPSASPTGSAT